MQNRNFLSGLTLATAMLLGVAPGLAEARQTSIDSQLLEAFQNIDERVKVHESDAKSREAHLATLASEVEEHRSALAALSSDLRDPKVREQRRLHHAKLIESTAQWLNRSFKHADSAANVISANLSELVELAKVIPNSLDAQKSAIEIENRIRQNIDAGHSMREALVQIRDWSQQYPDMAERFQSLQRITLALDRKITIDKKRLGGRRFNHEGIVASRHEEALDRTMTRLADAYAEVDATKLVLEVLREDLEVAIHLSRMEMTQEVALRAIPQVGHMRLPTNGVGTLPEMTDIIREVSDSIVDATYYPAPDETLADSTLPALESTSLPEISPTENF